MSESTAWAICIAICVAIAIALFGYGHWILGLIWCIACLRKWLRAFREYRSALAAVWILSVQLVNNGPIYHLQVPNCLRFTWYVQQVLASDARARLPVSSWGAMSCAWWDQAPPEMQDVANMKPGRIG